MELPEELISEIRQKTTDLALKSFRARLKRDWRLICLDVSLQRVMMNRVHITLSGTAYYQHTPVSAIFDFDINCTNSKAWSIRTFHGRLRGINLSLMPRECRNAVFTLPEH